MDPLALLAECEYVIEKMIMRLKNYEKMDLKNYKKAKKDRKDKQGEEKKKQQKMDEEEAKLKQNKLQEEKRAKRLELPFGKRPMPRAPKTKQKKHEVKKIEYQDWQKDFITYDLGDTLEHF